MKHIRRANANSKAQPNMHTSRNNQCNPDMPYSNTWTMETTQTCRTAIHGPWKQSRHAVQQYMDHGNNPDMPCSNTWTMETTQTCRAAIHGPWKQPRHAVQQYMDHGNISNTTSIIEKGGEKRRREEVRHRRLCPDYGVVAGDGSGTTQRS